MISLSFISKEQPKCHGVLDEALRQGDARVALTRNLLSSGITCLRPKLSSTCAPQYAIGNMSALVSYASSDEDEEGTQDEAVGSEVRHLYGQSVGYFEDRRD